MWITIQLTWDDGDREHAGHVGLWFPGTANISNIRVKLTIRLDPITGGISVDVQASSRRGVSHFSDDEPVVV